MNSADRSDRVKMYFPVLSYIIATFILESFEVPKATNLIISAFIAFFSFGVMSAMIRQKYGERPDFKPVSTRMGILSGLLVLCVANGFIHWYKLIHIDYRTYLMFALMLAYLIVLFNAVHLLNAIDQQLGKEK